jgi:hypothetical protein
MPNRKLETRVAALEQRAPARVSVVLVRRIVGPGELDRLPATVREAVPRHLAEPVQRLPDEDYNSLIDRALGMLPASAGCVRLIAE